MKVKPTPIERMLTISIKETGRVAVDGLKSKLIQLHVQGRNQLHDVH